MIFKMLEINLENDNYNNLIVFFLNMSFCYIVNLFIDCISFYVCLLIHVSFSRTEKKMVVLNIRQNNNLL